MTENVRIHHGIAVTTFHWLKMVRLMMMEFDPFRHPFLCRVTCGAFLTCGL